MFFDNLQVVHTRGVILEETHYYPFGLTMAGVSSKALAFGEPENKYKYNGIEFNNDLDLNTYDALYRNLDPQTGRWWQIDPKVENMEAWSPYASNFNNPILYNDYLGDEPDGGGGGFWDEIVNIVDNALLSASGVVNGALNTLSGGFISADPFSIRGNLSGEQQTLYDNSVQIGQIGILFSPGSKSSTVTPALQPVGIPAIPAAVTVKPVLAVPPILNANQNNQSNNRKSSNEKLIEEAKAAEAKEAAAKARQENRQKATNRGNSRTGNSNRNVKGEHDSTKKGGGKAKENDHENANARRVREQKKAQEREKGN